MLVVLGVLGLAGAVMLLVAYLMQVSIAVMY